MAEPRGNIPPQSYGRDRKRPQKTTATYVAAPQWIPKATRQQATPRDQRIGPAAAHIRFQGHVDNPEESGEGNPEDQEHKDLPEFVDAGNVMCAKRPGHRPHRKNKTCNMSSSTTIAPSQAQV